MIWIQKNWEEMMLARIDAESPLTEKDLREFVSQCEISRDEEKTPYGEKNMFSLIKLLDRYFVIWWEEDLTGRKSDTFDKQPVEVFFTFEREKTVRYRETVFYSKDESLIYTQREEVE